MKKIMWLGILALFLTGCQAMQESLEDKNLRVVNASSASVTIAGDGNLVYNRQPDIDAIMMAQETCRKLGHDRAEYQSTELEAEHYTNYYLFLCISNN